MKTIPILKLYVSHIMLSVKTITTKNICAIIFMVVVLSGNKVCQAQETITVPLESFTKIKISNTSKVKLTPGNTNSITFEGLQEDTRKVKEFVENGELTISGKPLSKMAVTFLKLEEIEINGAAAVTCSGIIEADEFDIDISGAGDLSLNLQAREVKVEISGAGNLTLTGSSDLLDMEITGAGNVNAEAFKTKTCNADISGSGQCTVDVTDELNSHITGSGSVNYKNPPARINKDYDAGKNDDIDVTESADGDTTRLRLGHKKILIVNGSEAEKKSKKQKVQPHWAGIDIGFNGYLTADNKMTPNGYDFLTLNQAKSIAININFFDYNIKLYKRYIMLVSGLGLTYNNYRFKSDSLIGNGGSGIYAAKPDSFAYSKSKLTVSYLTVPVLLEFNTSKYTKRSFHISTGAIFGYRLGSHTKQVYSVEGKKYKPKTFDEFSINPWRMDATVRLGYRDYTLFANYNLVSLFRKDKGPELYPYTIGISLIGW